MQAVGFDHAGADGIGADLAGTEFVGEGFGDGVHGVHGGLGGAASLAEVMVTSSVFIGFKLFLRT